MKYWIIIGLLASVSPTILTPRANTPVKRVYSNPGLSVSVTPLKKTWVWGEPVQLMVRLTNTSQTDLLCETNADRVDVTMHPTYGQSLLQAHVISNKNFAGGIVNLSLIKSKTAIEIPILLDEYFSFRRRGSAVFAYSFSVGSYAANRSRQPIGKTFRFVTLPGAFTISVGGRNPRALEVQLNRTAKGLNSISPTKRRYAVKALGYFKSPLAVRYLEKALHKADLAPYAIRSLGNFDNALASKAVQNSLFSQDPDVVKAALETFESRKVIVPDSTIRFLLASNRGPHDLQTRYVTIQYLSKVGQPHHAVLLQPLVKNSNPYIARIATSTMRKLIAKSQHKSKRRRQGLERGRPD